MNVVQKNKNNRLLRTYGISLKEWEVLYKQQKGKCYLCEKQSNLLNVDHRHVKKYKTLSLEDRRKEVRGLLCMFCNKFVVGSLEHSKTPRLILNNLVKYFTLYRLKNDL